MTNQRGWSRFEGLIVASAIGLIMLVGISRYIDLARDTRRVGFELLAHNFSAAVAMTRVQWLLKISSDGQTEYLVAGDKNLYLNAEGWPVATEPVSSESSTNGKIPVRQCYQLWQVMLQNPESATLEGRDTRGKRRFHISSIGKGACRYELVTKDPGSHFFDYFPATGQIILSVPVQKSIPSL